MNDNFSPFVCTIKKVYFDKKIDLKRIKELLDTKKITVDEYNYIVDVKGVNK